eukprot:8690697-Pyramimonas_sp.AAC.1
MCVRSEGRNVMLRDEIVPRMLQAAMWMLSGALEQTIKTFSQGGRPGASAVDLHKNSAPQTACRARADRLQTCADATQTAKMDLISASVLR